MTGRKGKEDGDEKKRRVEENGKGKGERKACERWQDGKTRYYKGNGER